MMCNRGNVMAKEKSNFADDEIREASDSAGKRNGSGKVRHRYSLGQQIRNALLPMMLVTMGTIMVVLCVVIRREGIKQAEQQAELKGTNVYNDIAAPVLEIECEENSIAAMYEHEFLQKNADVGEFLRTNEAKPEISSNGFYYVTSDGTCYTVDDKVVTGTEKPEYLDEQWYTSGATHTTAAVSMCTFNSKSGEYCLNVSRQMRASNGNVVGVIAIDISLEELKKSFNELEGDPSCEMMLLDTANKIVVSASDTKIDGYMSKTGKIAMVDDMFRDIANGHIQKSYFDGMKRKYVNVTQINDTPLYSVAYFDETDVMKNMNVIMLISFILIVAGVIIMSSAIVAVTRRKTKALIVAKEAVKRMCNGDFTISIDDSDHRYDDEISEITGSLNSFIAIMQDMLKQLRDIADQTDAQASDFSDMSKGIDDNAMKQSTDIQELNQSLIQMAGATQHLALDASELAQIANETQEQSGQAGRDMNEAMQAMQKAKDAQKTIFYIADRAQEAKEKIGKLPGTEDIVASIDKSIENILVLQKSFEVMEASFANSSDALRIVGKQNEKLYYVASSIAAISEEQAASSEEISAAAESTASVVSGTEDETAILNDGAQMLRHNASEMKSKMKQFTLPGDKTDYDEYDRR